jgi:hypothetical protein
MKKVSKFFMSSNFSSENVRKWWLTIKLKIFKLFVNSKTTERNFVISFENNFYCYENHNYCYLMSTFS